MKVSLWLAVVVLITACASLDKTNILPGQRVDGLGFSFSPPTQKPWFSSVYGSSHQIKLNQLNFDDSYSILISLARGPSFGMYQNAKQHLNAFQRNNRIQKRPEGFLERQGKAWVDTRYGKLCVRHSSQGEDWAGRNSAGPAIVEKEGLICAHETLDNVLLSIEFTRRYETYAEHIELSPLATTLFSSIEYEPLD